MKRNKKNTKGKKCVSKGSKKMTEGKKMKSSLKYL
jgi:hypothetical protein